MRSLRSLAASAYEPVAASAAPPSPVGPRRAAVAAAPPLEADEGTGAAACVAEEPPGQLRQQRGRVAALGAALCLVVVAATGPAGPLQLRGRGPGRAALEDPVQESKVGLPDSSVTAYKAQDTADLEVCKFVPASYGTNGCPFGLKELALEECQASPASFSGRLHVPFVLESKYFPRGCFQCASDAGCEGNPIYFNSHPDGSEFPGRRPLCKSCEARPVEEIPQSTPDANMSGYVEYRRWNDSSERVMLQNPSQAVGTAFASVKVVGRPSRADAEAKLELKACTDDDASLVEALRQVGQELRGCGDAASLCVESLVSTVVRLHCPASCRTCPGVTTQALPSSRTTSTASGTTETTTTIAVASTTSTTQVPTLAPPAAAAPASTTIALEDVASEPAPGWAAGAGDDACLIEVNTDYLRDDLGPGIPGITSAELCRTICQVNPKCGAWTWGQKRLAPGLTDTCFLKKLAEGKTFKKRRKVGVVSGLPCQVNGDNAPLNTLFCWALTQPRGYEPKLLESQYKAGVSLFACDEYALYSDKVFNIGDVVTSNVHRNITAEYGGEFYTALNTKIFAAVWTKVIQEGRFEYHSWTVKVDPDTVFLPGRLRAILQKYVERPNGVYVNNCKYGLHGPVEVFSKNAVRAWGAGSKRCFVQLYKGCNGECAWGEDLFVDQCLWKVLSVEREDNFDILQEDHCDPPRNWRKCLDPAKAAFHPFKGDREYFSCLKAAEGIDRAGAGAGRVAAVKVLQ